MFLLDYHIHTSISAWIYENWVNKHFVDCFNFPCLSLFTVWFAYVILFYLTFFGVGWGHCFVVRDLCESGHGGNFMNLHSFYPPPLSPLSLSLSPSLKGGFLSLPRILYYKWQLFEISAPKAGFIIAHGTMLCDVGRGNYHWLHCEQ